jgi:NAD(P)-dependent dehydrogenase (short-subunit alcohol dehydrogenase family)
VQNALGAVDILVNNAVVRHFAPIDHFPVEAWDSALAVNLSAAFHLVRLALPACARGLGIVACFRCAVTAGRSIASIT